MSVHTRCVSDDASFEQDLSMLIDGELTPAREREVRSHLDGCAPCSQQLATFERVDRVLGEAAPPEVRESLQTEIWDAIESNTDESQPIRAGQDDSRPRPEPQPARASRRGVRRWGGSLLAIAASLAIYLSIGDPNIDLDQVSDEELAVALELDTIRDLDVIANLELVERLVAMGAEAG